MHSVTITRTIDASRTDIREAMLELERFTLAAGFDEVDVDGRTIRVANAVGVAEIELELAVVDDPDAAFAYEQREGIFEEMRTAFTLTSVPDGTEVEATTEFALDIPLVGGVLDATLIKRQRRTELEAQLDYIEEAI
ncbi:SRPBCC family protein [Halobaculum roseum]|uniref:SRPBCC family protein n=1 Tax=Halobaculum roseum TaxID=2175149 RepID=A0ABD5MQF4_9EURY|nr:SRPBCC family protein [Halobaculum roseum]QZY04527.1 SRPBCC family protein [Halobaculum roseum]